MLADDLTGALEVRAKFAATGLPVLTTINVDFPVNKLCDEAVLVIETETWHVRPEHANRCVFEISRAVHATDFKWAYEKTDSTLCGNIGAEIKALSEATQTSPSSMFPPTRKWEGRPELEYSRWAGFL